MLGIDSPHCPISGWGWIQPSELEKSGALQANRPPERRFRLLLAGEVTAVAMAQEARTRLITCMASRLKFGCLLGAGPGGEYAGTNAVDARKEQEGSSFL